MLLELHLKHRPANTSSELLFMKFRADRKLMLCYMQVSGRICNFLLHNLKAMGDDFYHTA